jgi:hypothetical protein
MYVPSRQQTLAFLIGWARWQGYTQLHKKCHHQHMNDGKQLLIPGNQVSNYQESDQDND